MGEDIRNEKVTPRGTPAEVNPIKSGIEGYARNLDAICILDKPESSKNNSSPAYKMTRYFARIGRIKNNRITASGFNILKASITPNIAPLAPIVNGFSPLISAIRNIKRPAPVPHRK